jgi:CubicO group peptidase (beta-lactamase class C family)
MHVSNATTLTRNGFGPRLATIIAVFLHGSLLGGESDADYAQTVSRLKQLAEAEIERGILTGVTIALVDDQQIVYAAGVGWADKAERKPATRATVYRAGSISKLFTALAAMQLVERDELDLDEPVVTYWPGFRLVDRFDDSDPITLRQLMCHRSGLVRESPVGGYLDPSEPSIAASVGSLADCVLVHPPNTKTKYSNIGVTVVGHVVAQVSGQPFVEYERRHVLGPLGMTSSSFLADDKIRDNLSTSYMHVADGRGGFRSIESPHFELGTIPAGNLYTSAVDLARFLSFLFAEGAVDGRQVVQPETLAEMFTPQLTSEESGFGLGFYVGQFRDRKKVSHSGAVYGFSSSLVAIPDLKVGVIVLANEDIAMGPVRKLSDAALGWTVDAKLGTDPPKEQEPSAPPPIAPKKFIGDYESVSYWAHIKEDTDGALMLNISGQRFALTATGKDEFVADGRWASDAEVVFHRDGEGRVTGFETRGQTYYRVDPDAVSEIPDAWRKLIGSYGPEFIPLIVSVRHGHLYAMTENMVDYRLTPLNRRVFNMPPGMYEDEQLVFQFGTDGRVHSAILAGMELLRSTP